MWQYNKTTRKWLIMIMLQRKQVHDHQYRILIFGGSRSGKLNALLNLIKNKDVDNYSFINKIYLCVSYLPISY